MDFGYSLGILHHVPDIAIGIKQCVNKLKNGALFYFIYIIALIIVPGGLDRFGKRLEQRCTRKEIENMMISAGLDNIKFSNSKPFWCAVGYKSSEKVAP